MRRYLSMDLPAEEQTSEGRLGVCCQAMKSAHALWREGRLRHILRCRAMVSRKA